MKITWKQLYSDLHGAYEDTRQTKVNSDAHIEYAVDLEFNLDKTCTAIYKRTYDPGPAKRFLCEDPVKREIFCSSFFHRVVCRLLYNYLRPVLEPTFIYDSYSCQKGKGTQMGREQFAHHVRSCTQNYQYRGYVLKGDLSGYFMSINRKILLKLVLDRIHGRLNARDTFGHKFEDTLDLEMIEYLTTLVIMRDPLEGCITIGREEEFLDIPPQKLLQNAPPGVGLAIGDITSQLFSNVYLDELDRYAKHVLHCKYYGRYVDDFYIVDLDKRELQHVKLQIEQFLRERLQLRLNMQKTRILRADQGVQFLGVMVLPFRMYACTRTIKRFRRTIHKLEEKCNGPQSPDRYQLEHMRSSINSYLGHLYHFKTHRIVATMLSHSPLLQYFELDQALKLVFFFAFQTGWPIRSAMTSCAISHNCACHQP